MLKFESALSVRCHLLYSRLLRERELKATFKAVHRFWLSILLIKYLTYNWKLKTDLAPARNVSLVSKWRLEQRRLEQRQYFYIVIIIINLESVSWNWISASCLQNPFTVSLPYSFRPLNQNNIVSQLAILKISLNIRKSSWFWLINQHLLFN